MALTHAWPAGETGAACAADTTNQPTTTNRLATMAGSPCARFAAPRVLPATMNQAPSWRALPGDDGIGQGGNGIGRCAGSGQLAWDMARNSAGYYCRFTMECNPN
jgi:hypothetical protein